MKRSFCLGSEWLYYKIYTGSASSDLILTEKLNLAIISLIERKLITKWFFIRYNDPDDHIRIRFNCENIDFVSVVIKELYPIFNELIDLNIIWKLQTDTYQREIERYGENTIEDSEKIFYYDSEMILKYLKLKYNFKNESVPLLFSLLSIDNFLNSFSLNEINKLALMNELQLSFKMEFQADKLLKKEFDKHYRELSNNIERFLTYKEYEDYSEFYNIMNKKNEKANLLTPSILNNLKIPLFDFLQIHIHMMINRQYTSKQRHYECLIYDHLYRYYKSVIYKKTI